MPPKRKAAYLAADEATDIRTPAAAAASSPTPAKAPAPPPPPPSKRSKSAAKKPTAKKPTTAKTPASQTSASTAAALAQIPPWFSIPEGHPLYEASLEASVTPTDTPAGGKRRPTKAGRSKAAKVSQSEDAANSTTKSKSAIKVKAKPSVSTSTSTFTSITQPIKAESQSVTPTPNLPPAPARTTPTKATPAKPGATTSSLRITKATPKSKPTPKPKPKPKPIINTAPTSPLSLYFFGTNTDGQLGFGSSTFPVEQQHLDLKAHNGSNSSNSTTDLNGSNLDLNSSQTLDGSSTVAIPGAIPPSTDPSSPAKSPTFNSLLSGLGVVQIALGEAHGVALTGDGKVVSWGRGDFGCLGRRIGRDRGGVEDGDVDGDGEDGDLDGTRTGVTEEEMWYDRATPKEVDRSLMGDVVITQVAACANASFALTEGGDVFGWGTFRNNQGIMGLIPPSSHNTDATPHPTYTPTPLPSLHNTKITTLNTSPSSQHLLALSTVTNTLYALGAGEQNQLGRRLTERNKLHGLDASRVEFVVRPKGRGRGQRKGKVEVKAVCTADESSYALDAQGQIWYWGAQFGSPASAEGKDTALPQLHPAFLNLDLDGDPGKVVQLAASKDVIFARTSSGNVLSAGRLDSLGSGHDISTLPRGDVAAVGGWRIGGRDSGAPAIEGPSVLLKARRINLPVDEDGSQQDVKIIDISTSSCTAAAISQNGHCFVWGSGSGWRHGLALSGRGGHFLGSGMRRPTQLDSLHACQDVSMPEEVWMGGLGVESVRGVVLGGGVGAGVGGFGVYLTVEDPGEQLRREGQEVVEREEGKREQGRWEKRGEV